MPQISPYLKPAGGGSDSSRPRRGFLQPPSSGEPERNALNMPIAPVAGFWRRFGALAFDFTLIFFLFRGVGLAAGDLIIDAGYKGHIIASGLVLMYFVFGNGPVGNGRTLGKLLVGIRIVRLDGQVMGIGQSAARTALLYPGVVMSVFISPLIFDPAQYDQQVLGILFGTLLMLALFVGNFFAIAFNPFKQGFHDHLAKTLVVPVAVPDANFEMVRERVGEGWRKYYKQTQINGAISLTLIFALMSVMTVKSVKDRPDLIDSANLRYRLATETFGAHTRLQEGFLPYDVRAGGEADVPIEARIEFNQSLLDPDSFEGLTIVLGVNKQGRFRLGRDEMERLAEEFANRYRNEFWAEMPPQAIFGHDDPDRIPANLLHRPIRVDVTLTEYSRLFFMPAMAVHEAFRMELAFPPVKEAGARGEDEVVDEGEAVDEE